MLQFEKVSLVKQKHPILQDVTLSFPSHTLSVLVGKNGSGKSSLVGCVSGEHRYSGSIRLGDLPLEGIRAEERAKKISILPQSLPFAHFTVEQVVFFGRLPHHAFGYRLSAEDREKVETAMRLVGIESMRGRMVDTLSGGEKQKVYLALLLAQDTEWMIFDEPTTFMDAVSAHRFMELLCHIQRTEQKSVLVVLHDLSAAVRYGEHIAVLKDGRACFDGTTEDCLSQRVLENVFSLRRIAAEGQTFFVSE